MRCSGGCRVCPTPLTHASTATSTWTFYEKRKTAGSALSCSKSFATGCRGTCVTASLSLWPRSTVTMCCALFVRTGGSTKRSGVSIISYTQIPTMQTLLDWHQSPFPRNKRARGTSTRTQENIGRVLQLKEQTQGRLSIRSEKAQLNLGYATVAVILKNDLKLHPYKPLKTSFLTEIHRQQRLNFCRWVIEKHATDGLFHRRIIFTDETQQDLDPSVNHQNNRRWSSTQPFDWEEKTGQGPKAIA